MPRAHPGRRWWGPLLLAALTTAHAQTPHVHPGGSPPGTSAPAMPAAPSAPPSGPAPAGNATDPATAWRAANDAVGAFPRGHADILRWEREHAPAPASPPLPSGPSWTLDDVSRRALLGQPDLLIIPGQSRPEELQRQQAAAAVVLKAQAAWIEAIAARRLRQLAEQAHLAGDVGAELANRTRQVGNVSAERALRESLPSLEAKERLAQAVAAERHALVRLWQRLGGDGPESAAAHLPAALPERPPLPAADEAPALAARQRAQHPDWPRLRIEAERRRSALPAHAWETLQTEWAQAVARGQPGAARLDPSAPRWPHAWSEALAAQMALAQLERQLDGDLWLALDAARRAEARARHQREDMVPARRRLEEETLLRYNGMLASTWELLAAARERIAAEQEAVKAERDAWLAWLDLQAVLSGLPLPDRAPATDADTPATPVKGH
ncbi:hypothetical protein [Tepidimonas sp.]|uniref:hypothetical protein n=1 Tax=Tepidimonas sp. TaxID=2002775 RepID=UPI00391B5370